MTKKLTNQEKKEKKAARKQQKAASTTVVTVTQPKHEGSAEPPADLVNLCDTCAYECGECDGKPKFSIDVDLELTGAAADRVVECKGFLNVEQMPTVQETLKGQARYCDVEHLGNYPDCFQDCPKDVCDGVPDAAHDAGDKLPELIIVCSGDCGRTTDGALTGKGEYRQVDEGPVPEWTCQECLDKANVEAEEETATDELPFVPAQRPDLPDPKRFNKEEDHGVCPSCEAPLKRTAFNRYVDAVRCTNPRCRSYRAVVKTLSTGVK